MNLRFTIYDLRLALQRGHRRKLFSNHQLSISNHQFDVSSLLPVVSK